MSLSLVGPHIQCAHIPPTDPGLFPVTGGDPASHAMIRRAKLMRSDGSMMHMQVLLKPSLHAVLGREGDAEGATCQGSSTGCSRPRRPATNVVHIVRIVIEPRSSTRVVKSKKWKIRNVLVVDLQKFLTSYVASTAAFAGG